MRLTEARSDYQGIDIDVTRVRPFALTADRIVRELSLEFFLSLRESDDCGISHGGECIWSLNILEEELKDTW